LWVPLVIHQLLTKRTFFTLLFSFIIAGVPIFALSLLADYVFYGKFVFVFYNFLQFNLLSGGSSYFGAHHILYYITNVLTSQLAIFIPVFIAGFVSYTKDSLNKRVFPYVTIILSFYIAVFSLIKHKEYRFLLPVVPFCLMLSAYTLEKLRRNYNGLLKAFIVLSLLTEIGLIGYDNFALHNAPHILKSIPNDSSVKSIGVWHEIYGAPYYSIFHRTGERVNVTLPISHPAFLEDLHDNKPEFLRKRTPENNMLETYQRIKKGDTPDYISLLKKFNYRMYSKLEKAIQYKYEKVSSQYNSVDMKSYNARPWPSVEYLEVFKRKD